MKSRFVNWSLGVILSALPFAAGCAPAAAGAGDDPPVVVGLTNTNATADVLEADVLEEEDMDLPEGVDPAEAEVTPVTTGVTVPNSLSLSAPVSEIVKLVNSGMDESVLQAYATNSASTFNLSADQIIYLKDIGVPAAVITAMIQRDQVLKQSGTAIVEAPAPEPAVTNELADQPGPPPEEVAPQPDGTAPNEVATTPPQVSVNYNTFYDSLSPYGSWVDVAGYGLCWQPSVVVVNPGWQPYFNDGRWVYTDAGWYWYSNYSWGWAPFHYGRWFRHHRIGWCWRPGYVWAPSWVTWRYNDAYCGWAPLPPGAHYRSGFGFSYYGKSVAVNFGFGLDRSCYSFVPIHHFRSHRLHHHHVPHHQVNNIYNSTVVATKIVNNNNFIVNQGIPASKVARATGSPVQKVAIKQVKTPLPSNRAERLNPTGKNLVVYRPELLQNRSASKLTQRPSNPFLTGSKTAASTPNSAKAPVANANANRFAPRKNTDSVPVVKAPGTPIQNRLTSRPVNNGGAVPTPQPTAKAKPFAPAQTAATPQATPSATKPANPFVADSSRPVNRFNTRPQTPAASPTLNTTPSANTATRPNAPLILRGPSQASGATRTPAATAAPTPSVRPSLPNSNPFLKTTPQAAPTVPRSTFSPAPTANSGSRLTQRPQATVQTPTPSPSAPLQNRFIAPQTTTPSFSRPTAPQAPARTAPSPSISAPTFRSQPSYRPPTPSVSQPRFSTPAPSATPRISTPSFRPSTPSFRPSTPTVTPQARSFTPSRQSFSAPSRSFTPSPSPSMRSPMSMPSPSSGGSRLSNRPGRP